MNQSLLSQIDEKHRLPFTVEGKEFNSKEEFLTGAQIKEVAGILVDTDLFLAVAEPWKDELITNETRVNLARPEIEHFYIKKKLPYTINGVHFESDRQFIKGRQIRKQGNIPADQDIFLSIAGPWDDEHIKNDEYIDLARPGIEHFYSKKVMVDVVLIVNAREKTWKEKKISYSEVVILAFGQHQETPNQVFTVTYKRGPEQNPEGSMVSGDSVFVKNKMIFNVRATDKS